MEHGVVEGNRDLRIKMVLDDGLSTASIFLNQKASEKFTGKDIDELAARIADEGSSRFVAGLRQENLGRRMQVEGRSIVDDQGFMFMADSAEIVEEDPLLSAAEVRNTWGVA